MLIFLERGLSFFLIGSLVAIKELTVNVLEIPSGAIADATGRRRAMMLSFAAYIISFIIFATGKTFLFLAVAMFFYAVGDSFRTGTHKAMIFQWLRLNDRIEEKTRVYGITRSWSQIGSAVSGLMAAIFVFISGTYQYVFWFATVPYALNLINFAGYPKELDGDHNHSHSLGDVWRRLRESLLNAIKIRPLRRLMVETMAWEGYFAAAKDYLQPTLQALAIGLFGYWFGTANYYAIIDQPVAGMLPETRPVWFSETRKTAILVGIVYSLLFLLSAWASRYADRFQKRFDGLQPASQRLWQLNLSLFACLAAAAFFNWTWLIVAAFVALTALKNLWRPILISRFDDEAEAKEGATILSIESQARHAATLVAAPILGLMVDWMNGRLIGIGMIGIALALLMTISYSRPRTAQGSA